MRSRDSWERRRESYLYSGGCLTKWVFRQTPPAVQVKASLKRTSGRRGWNWTREQEWISLRAVTRPVGLVVGGAGFSVIEPPDEGTRDVLHTVIRSVDFALCADPEQRMLLAVAAVSDRYGIAAGWDADAGAARGVGIPALALKAGMDRSAAEQSLDLLCARGMLIRLTAKHPPFAPVWVLPDYEDAP